MSGLELLGLVGLVGGTVTQMAAQSQAAGERSAAAQFEAQQYEIQEQQAKTAAAQAEAEKRSELTSSLETITAIRAGRGVGLTSGTARAVLGDTVNDAERDIQIERVNYLTQADLSRRAGLMAERKAQSSLLAGDFAMGSTLFGGLTSGSKYLQGRV